MNLNGSGSNVLVLGDGNLTFSLAFSHIFPDKYVIATVYEEENEWRRKYDGFNVILDEIRNKCINTKVFFEVDALNLKEICQKTKFADIIFNFPHHGGKTNLRKSRLLLHKIFESVAGILSTSSPYSTRFHLTLAPGQSGIENLNTNSCFASLPPNFRKDSWQPLELAAEFGLVAVHVERFDLCKFPAYFSSGYKDTELGFKNNKNSHTIAFEWSGHFVNAYNERFSLEKAKSIEPSECITIDKPVFHQFRPVRQYHISIVFGPSYQWQDMEKMIALEKRLFSIMNKFAGTLLVSIFELADKRCFAPGNLHNRIYCLIYQGIEIPLCRFFGNALHEELCSNLNRYFKNERYDLRIS